MKDAFIQEKCQEGHPNWQQAIQRQHQLYSRNNDIRTEFERDYTRVLHCEAFRRLKHKTQVFFAPRNDHICTRIEHVMHVASIASTICRALDLNSDLAWAIGLGHDLGHTPFGHLGERILSSLSGKTFSHELYSLKTVKPLPMQIYEQQKPQKIKLHSIYLIQKSMHHKLEQFHPEELKKECM